MILETQQLILRNFVRSDVPKYPAIRSRESHVFEAPSELTAERSEELVRGYIAAADCEPRIDFHMAVLDRRDGALVGSCGICLHGAGANTAYFSCEIAADYRRLGFGYQAAEAVLDMAFRQLELSYISTRVMAENEAGLRLVYRLGMRPTDAFGAGHSDSLLLGISQRDWSRPVS